MFSSPRVLHYEKKGSYPKNLLRTMKPPSYPKSRQLVEYVVLDVDPSSTTGDATAARFGYRTAYAQVVRASELGKNDAIVTVRTHLGHLLRPGDRTLGYDLRSANANGKDVEMYGQSRCMPYAVLVKKIYEKGGELHQAGGNF
jgi:nonsense-mediated mRNA decay protein 3